MQDSDIPPKFTVPWGASAGGAYIRAIPTASQIGIVPGAASLTDGWPPLDALPVAGGGIPPDIRDQNGILNAITKWTRWQQAGGTVVYDPTFQAAVGGYPKNAIIGSATTAGLFWLSTADNNVTNPDTSGAGWITYPALHGQASFVASGTFTPPPGVFTAFGRVWGPSGGSGGSQSTGSGGGGGAGGYAEKWFPCTPGTGITITLGTPGLAGGTGTNGTSGGTSSIGAIMSATGGTFGFGALAGAVGNGGTAGTGSGGTLNLAGGSATGGIIVGTLYLSGQGGSAPMGGSGGGQSNGSPALGGAPGGGPGGGANSFSGLAGSSGLVEIYW